MSSDERLALLSQVEVTMPEPPLFDSNDTDEDKWRNGFVSGIIAYELAVQALVKSSNSERRGANDSL